MLTGRVTDAPGRDAWNGFGAYAEDVADLAVPMVAGTLLLPRKAGFL
jgi:hypothetical protein